MYKMLVTITCNSDDSKGGFAMNTEVLSFNTASEANCAYDLIEKKYPKHAVYATAVRLYAWGE